MKKGVAPPRLLVRRRLHSVVLLSSGGNSRRQWGWHKNAFYLLGILFCWCLNCGEAFPEQGKWSAVLNETEPYFGTYKSLFKGSKIFINIQCSSPNDVSIMVNWMLRESPCWEEYGTLDILSDGDRKTVWKEYYESPDQKIEGIDYGRQFFFRPSDDLVHRCDNTIHFKEYGVVAPTNESDSDPSSATTNLPQKFLQTEVKETSGAFKTNTLSTTKSSPVFTVHKDGVYLLIVYMKLASGDINKNFQAEVKVQMIGEQGYLSATEWPLLIFYGGNCVVYVMYAMIWLVMSFCHWRDLLRIQFWIGAVIFLGMIEMAVFYGEYQSINSTGVSVQGAVIVAEIISCAKRTLARMLVVIVSIGFGIVKPRLGTTLHKIIVVGTLYFSLASTEACLRILHPVNGPSNKALMAGVPLSILDAAICYWIFHSLMSTTRTLRLRRNLVKLTLYRHFTNTLIFCLVSSVAFMIWSILYLKTDQCLRDWKEIWIDEAYWHMLFSIILLVIIILWRPSNNNQRYSFSPLVDNLDDEEEEDLVVNAAFSGNMKLRGKRNGNDNFHRGQSIEDELRWVEENIPADLAEGDLPALDSEEELISTKFELSKMQ